MNNQISNEEVVECTGKTQAPMQSTSDRELAELEAYITKITSSKRAAKGFLMRAGILDKNGQLDEHYC